MLVLTRHVGESVKIGDDVTVSIFEIKRGHVRIGIEAPKNIEVHREEVYKRIQRERTAGSACGSGAPRGSPVASL